MKLDKHVRFFANAELTKISAVYHEHIPLQQIFKVLKTTGLEPVQDDGTPWEGMLLGPEGRALIELKDVDNSLLVISWCKLQGGRYETIAYVS